MKESDTCQAILEEGIALGLERSYGLGYDLGLIEGAQRSLWIVGIPALGEPDIDTRQRIDNETDLTRLREWFVGVLEAKSWADLLGSSPLIAAS